jgi:hypothetical protein
MVGRPGGWEPRGMNRHAFKVKKLEPGGYRMTLKASDGAGNASKAVRKAFAVKKTKRG